MLTLLSKINITTYSSIPNSFQYPTESANSIQRANWLKSISTEAQDSLSLSYPRSQHEIDQTSLFWEFKTMFVWNNSLFSKILFVTEVHLEFVQKLLYLFRFIYLINSFVIYPIHNMSDETAKVSTSSIILVLIISNSFIGFKPTW